MAERYQRGDPRFPDDLNQQLMEMFLVGRELALSYVLEVDDHALDSMMEEFVAWRARQRASQPVTKEQIVLGILAPLRLTIASIHSLLTSPEKDLIDRAHRFDSLHSIQIHTLREGIVQVANGAETMVQFAVHGQPPVDTTERRLYDLASFVVMPKARKLGLELPFSCATRSDEDAMLTLIFEADVSAEEKVHGLPTVPHCRWADMTMIPYATRVQADFDTRSKVLTRHRVFASTGRPVVDLRLCSDQS